MGPLEVTVLKLGIWMFPEWWMLNVEAFNHSPLLAPRSPLL
jgi:hypothetical protein